MINTCFVIGGGPSLIGFNFSQLNGRDVIAVNKAILEVPNLKYFITVDYTFLKKIPKQRFIASTASKFFVADFSHPFLKEQKGQIVDTRFNLVYDLQDYDTIIKAKKQDGFGFSFNDFRTGLNSGYCALQLALILGYEKIYLLGFDLNVNGVMTHFHGGYGERPEKFSPKLTTYFDKFRDGLIYLTRETDRKVFSCSPTSRLNDLIPYKPVQEALCE